MPGLNVSVAARVLLAALAVAAAYSVRRVVGFDAVSPYAAAALLLWAASIGLAAAACRGPQAASTAGSGHRWNRTDGAIALGIVGLALALRTYALGERPMLGGDEAGWGMFARGIASGGGNPFGFGWYGWPALGEYVTALSLRGLGATIEGLRLPSALAGTLTAAIVWAYGARTTGRFGGAVAGLVAATTILHVHLSRQGFQNVFDGLFAIVVLAALERAWSERRRDLFILAGAALAIAQHFYASAHALPIIVLAWIALRFMLEGRRAAERWRDLAAMAFVSAVAAWPQLTLVLDHPSDWLSPISRQTPALPAGTEAASPMAFAVAMLALSDKALAKKLADFRVSQTEKVLAKTLPEA